MSTTNERREHRIKDSERQEWLDFVSEVQEKLRQANDPEAFLSSFSNDVIRKLANEPFYVLREKQLKPFRSSADTIMIQAGRAWGKTFTAAHWINHQASQRPGQKFALIGETAADVRDYMVEGDSGVLNVGHFRPKYEPSKRRVTWENGTTATLYSGEKTDQLRGLSASIIWADELAKYRYINEALNQIDMTLRESDNPQLLVTTTPRPLQVLRDLASDAEVIRGSSYENEKNLADRFKKKLQDLEDTRLAQQEIYAKILDANGDLWSENDIEYILPEDLKEDDEEIQFDEIIVGLDPSVSNREDGDECGIVVVGKIGNQAYVLKDASGQYTVTEWGNRLSELADDYHIDRIFAERNQGGGLVKQQVLGQCPNINYESVHTQSSKKVRAEPVFSLYDMSPPRVYHLGHHPKLEDQMLTFTEEEENDDRVDALVYALNSALLEDAENKQSAFETVLNAI